MSRRPDQRSAAAAAYRWLYSTARWLALRAAQLARKPLCERCSTDLRPVPATVVNHKKPHKGDRKLFFDPDNLESVCAPCHDGPIQRAEKLGFNPGVGADGWPVDAAHPAYKVH